MFKRKEFRDFHLQDDELTNGSIIRSKLISYLKVEHRDWYEKYSWWYTILWNWLSIAVIVFSTITSIIAALPNDAFDPQIKQNIQIIFPALAALATTFMIQFRMRDNLRLRDEGRIAIEELICDAYEITDTDANEILKKAMKIKKQSHAIERKQLAGFIGEESVKK